MRPNEGTVINKLSSYPIQSANQDKSTRNKHLLRGFYCSDWVEFMAAMGANTVPLTITSPPYDNMRDYEGYSFDCLPTVFKC